MRTPAVATLLPLTRRAFLQAFGLACVARLRPLAVRLSVLGDDFDWLMRWCSRTGCGGAPSFAAG